MELSQDYSEMLSELNAKKVRYLIVGAYAVAFHAEPRYTKDIDIWIDPESNNADRAWKALTDYGAPMRGCKPAVLKDKGNAFQIGVEPYRIDIIMNIADIPFESAWGNRVRSTLDGLPVNFLGLSDLIKAKQATGRPHDLIDLGLIKKKQRFSRKKKSKTTKKK
ncbi:MAG: hypothetical protein IPK83_06975 [Planctomycetes bacterium]|nr:hypothetical protein [Planctomycetota bacterium]